MIALYDRVLGGPVFLDHGVDIQLQFRQIPMTAVAVKQYRPAMDSCMVGIRLYRHGALPAPDFSDTGEYPEEYGRLA